MLELKTGEVMRGRWPDDGTEPLSIAGIQRTIDICDELEGWTCFHCEQKQLIINVACAWAFDQGIK